MNIRRLTTDDRPLYRALRLESLQESPEAFASTYADALLRTDESWESQTHSSATGPDRATFILVDSTQGALGLAALYRSEIHPETGDLLQMWVSPALRGNHWASTLLEEIFRWAGANEFSVVQAEVTPGNLRAIRFYEKYGFVSSERPDGTTILTKHVDPPFSRGSASLICFAESKPPGAHR
ncbi:GNAT family N-acetyltransferase [Luteolibacter pohnpeiensis]|uniref:GNAT family N-acetyltransferase n=2 Tax=Luteolibacter pohnpeiensis TaxID=454153 RepID=A0A934S906_9BACT|nr:GNAT family N-acetyltransferase [Luteolibacter pohnpeiensis]